MLSAEPTPPPSLLERLHQQRHRPVCVVPNRRVGWMRLGCEEVEPHASANRVDRLDGVVVSRQASSLSRARQSFSVEFGLDYLNEMSTPSEAVSEYDVSARSTDCFGRVLCGVRDHHFIIDGPVQNGCPGEEVTPVEGFLSAIAACGWS